MNITLIGYGKMGRAIEAAAQEAGDEIVYWMDIDENPLEAGFSGDWLARTDVFMDFSTAHIVPMNVANAVRCGIPIVVGTTGWYDQIDTVRDTVIRGGGACVWAGNFSLGVQIFFQLTRRAGEMLSRFEEYHPYLVETHHVQKLDAPSGTAIAMEKILGECYGRSVDAVSVRAGHFPGIHVAGFDSAVDTITLEHQARSRGGFARGALFAGRWIQGKQGFHAFEDAVFGEQND